MFFIARCAERQGQRFDCSQTRFELARTTIALWRLRRGRYTRMQFGVPGLGREGKSEPYGLREVRGAETHAGRTRGLRWCAVTVHRVCSAP